MQFSVEIRKQYFILIYLPWILSELVRFDPVTSYFISWGGSFFIFFISLCCPFWSTTQTNHQRQIMRPIFLIQLIFAGFMCCSSIFFMLDHLGFSFDNGFNLVPFLLSDQTFSIAKCQRLGLLSHAALVSGIWLNTKTITTPAYKFEVPNNKALLILLSGGSGAALLINLLPELLQWQRPLSYTAALCSASLLFSGAKQRQFWAIGLGLCGTIASLVTALLSGFKEALIVQAIIIFCCAYPYYRNISRLLAFPILILLFYLLPTYNILFRDHAWVKHKPQEQAGLTAYRALIEEESEQKVSRNTWDFLVNRFSEIGMFAELTRQVPAEYPYYGFEILENALYAIIPRAIWKEKPDTEQVAMARVYKAGLVDRHSSVSAKTRPIADAYLSGGYPIVFLSMLGYGLLVQSLCNKAVELFGSYEIGCNIVFNGLFLFLWRGNTFEFLLNNILYSYLLMRIIHLILIKSSILSPSTDKSENHPY